MSQNLKGEFVRSYGFGILVIISFCLALPLFFYKLGQTSLVSWDEAWYAEIARNILKNADLVNLTWNGEPYIDHPPAGFWIMALTFKIFGINEFWARFPSALSGFGSLFVVYFTGKELFNRIVGFSSALALASSPWFLFRARSGNLDSILTFSFILTILFALKAVKNKVYLIPFVLILAFLFLTKSVVPITVLPTLVVIFWKVKGYSLKDFKLPALLFIVFVGGWFVGQIINQPVFLRNYFKIGLPGIGNKISILENLNLMKEYLHNGIGKWFWPGIFSILVSLFLRQRRFLILSVFYLTFFLPFLFSQKGHIWHLIPLYPILILSFFGFIHFFLKKIIRRELSLFVILCISLYFSFSQIKRAWWEFIDIPAFTSDEAILSEEAGNQPGNFYLDGDFVPAAVFYSGKKVFRVSKDEYKPLFNKQEQFVLVTSQWMLDQENISKNKYEIIKKDRDKLLIMKKLL